jgi:hypothetical protein
MAETKEEEEELKNIINLASLGTNIISLAVSEKYLNIPLSIISFTSRLIIHFVFYTNHLCLHSCGYYGNYGKHNS